MPCNGPALAWDKKQCRSVIAKVKQDFRELDKAIGFMSKKLGRTPPAPVVLNLQGWAKRLDSSDFDEEVQKRYDKRTRVGCKLAKKIRQEHLFDKLPKSAQEWIKFHEMFDRITASTKAEVRPSRFNDDAPIAVFYADGESQDISAKVQIRKSRFPKVRSGGGRKLPALKRSAEEFDAVETGGNEI
jgi:hypothetical protein